MNPFLESTVARPQPDAEWRRPPCQTSRPAFVKRRLQAAGAHGATAAFRRRVPANSGCARRMLRVATLAGALLVPGAAAAIDINAASTEQLLEVKGIGPKMARVIIEERERGGRFESIDDLSERVRGIGPKKAASLVAAGVTVGGMPSSKTAAGRPGGEAPAAGTAKRKR